MWYYDARAHGNLGSLSTIHFFFFLIAVKTDGDIIFAKTLSILLPRAVHIGHNILNDAARIIDELELEKNAVIVCDPVTKEVAAASLRDQLVEHGYEISLYEISGANEGSISGANRLIEKQKSRFTIGVGGGRSIDVAKYTAFTNRLPFISVPTAASHDGIVSGRASIHQGGRAKSMEARPPVALLADTGIIAKSPFRLLSAGYGDVISNYSAVKDWELSQRLTNEHYSSYAAVLSKMSAELLIRDANLIKEGLEESAWKVVKALLGSGVAMAIAGSSRPASGAEHMFSHTLDHILDKPALHGEQCALGSIIMMYLHGEDWRFTRDAMEKIGLATTAAELEIPDDMIVKAIVDAPKIRPERFTILGSGISEEAARRAATITGVIQ